jgi:uncharacterized protein YukJ
MPLKQYGVLKGRPIDRQLGSGKNPHYQVHVVDDTVDYRIAINAKSQEAPSEVEYLIDSHFQSPLVGQLDELPLGWFPLQSRPNSGGLDYIRSNLFDPRKMVPLPLSVAGPDNDLNEKIDHYIQRAMGDENAMLYAFGERWGPEAGLKDKIFGFLPGNGVHDIHMNQANSADFQRDDGVYQDGGVLLHFPDQNQWVALFLKFQSQGWHSDDKTGHVIKGNVSGPPSDDTNPANPFDPGAHPTPEAPDGAVRIVSALVKSLQSPEVETVTLLNLTSQAVNLAGWKLLDRDKNVMSLTGMIEAGDTVRITLRAPVMLPNKGGIITLLNTDGLRVDGVSYTKVQVSNPGYSVKF